MEPPPGGLGTGESVPPHTPPPAGHLQPCAVMNVRAEPGGRKGAARGEAALALQPSPRVRVESERLDPTCGPSRAVGSDGLRWGCFLGGGGQPRGE